MSTEKGDPNLRPGAKGGVRDKNRQEKKRILRDAAVDLFLSKGIESTTIDDVTKQAGVAKGSFYRYFEGKEQLVHHLFGPLIAELKEAFARCSQSLEGTHTAERMMDVYRDLGAELTHILLQRSHVVKLYLQESRGPHTEARAPVLEAAQLITDQAISLTHLAHKHGLLRPFPPAISALTVVGAAERLLLAVLAEEDIGNPLEVPENLASLILEGLLLSKKSH
jgi:AcrR family transcriptional regulator